MITLPVLTLLLALGFTLYYRHTIATPIDLGGDIFKVSRGDSLSKIANSLADKGILTEPYTIRAYAKLNNIGHRIQAGEYIFPPSLTIPDFVLWLGSGKFQVGIKITIVEGWTFQQMRAAIARAPKLQMFTADWSDEKLMAEVGDADSHPEGQFYPDTYIYRSGDSDLTLFKKSYALMQDKLEIAWSNRKDGIEITSPDEALIMASIIERESQVDDELSEISGVFDNRLKKGMRLQTDPTVIYGVGDDYRGNITYAHLRTDTPYNTYTRAGLPPTPISLPGYAALLAAVTPNKTESLYFVASHSGRHKFSKTLKEHNAAVNKYIRKK